MKIVQCHVYENSSVGLLARVHRFADGLPCVAADIDSITIRVFNRTDNTEVTPSLTPEVGDVVSDELLTDARWSVDAIGFNFAYTLPSSKLVDGDKRYDAEVVLVSVSGDEIPIVYRLTTIPILSR